MGRSGVLEEKKKREKTRHHPTGGQEGWCQDNGNRSNQESKFDFSEGQQKIKIVRTSRQSNLPASCQSIFFLQEEKESAERKHFRNVGNVCGKFFRSSGCREITWGRRFLPENFLSEGRSLLGLGKVGRNLSYSEGERERQATR